MRITRGIDALISPPRHDVEQRVNRGPSVAAKRVAVHVAVQLGISISDIAVALNVSRQRGSKVALTALCAGESSRAAAVFARLSKVDKVDTVPG